MILRSIQRSAAFSIRPPVTTRTKYNVSPIHSSFMSVSTTSENVDDQKQKAPSEEEIETVADIKSPWNSENTPQNSKKGINKSRFRQRK